MAGHNKWSKIKHKKGAADARKSKNWTKLIREITVAAKLGGDDPSGNPRLRKALDDAKAENITKDTIGRALARASGKDDSADYEELAYEGYGPGGIAVLVDCLSDNRNRTLSDVRIAFNKNGGSLGAEGSVRFGFKKKGQLVFDVDSDKGKKPSEDALMEVGLEAGVEDIVYEQGAFVVTCEAEDFHALRTAYENAGFICDQADIVMLPDNMIKLSGEPAKGVLKLIEALEDLDDVQKVWSNLEIDDEEMERLMAE